MLLIGIGVSLFIFFFQQNFQDERRRDAEIEQVLAKLASRVGKASADLEFLPEYDAILDDGGPYINPENGGSNRAVTASGADLAKQIEELRVVERDVALDDFGDLDFSADLQGSPLMTEIDPAVWFTMHRDENDLHYAVRQLAADYKDLAEAIGDADPASAVADASRREGQAGGARRSLRPRSAARPQPSRLRPRLLVREPGPRFRPAPSARGDPPALQIP